MMHKMTWQKMLIYVSALQIVNKLPSNDESRLSILQNRSGAQKDTVALSQTE